MIPLPFTRYIVRHVYNAHGEPVTEIMDRRKETCSRIFGLWNDRDAVDWLKVMRGEWRH